MENLALSVSVIALGAVLILYFVLRRPRPQDAGPTVSSDDAYAWKEVFEQRVAGTPYRPPSAPVGIIFEVSTNADDDYVPIDRIRSAKEEGGVWQSDARDTLIGIKYIDARGVETARDISVQRFNQLYVEAWCFERDAWRTFRWDRISAAFNAQTGEVIDDPLAFMSDIVVQAERCREYWPVVRRGLRILAYVAHCDGSVHPAEREVMRSYIRAALAASKGAPNADEITLDALVAQTERTLPHPDTIRESLDAIVAHERQSTRYRIVAEHAVKLVEADGTVTPEEQVMVAGLRDWLRRMDEKKSATRPKRARVAKAA